MAVTGKNNFTDKTQFNYAVHTEATVADGTSETSAFYDMQNYDEISFIITVGTVAGTATLNIKVQENDVDSATGVTDITGAAASIPASSADHLEIMAINSGHFTKRYLRVVITASGGNSTHVTCVAARARALRTSSVDNA